MIPKCIDNLKEWVRNNKNCDGCVYCDDPYDCTIPLLLLNYPTLIPLIQNTRVD